MYIFFAPEWTMQAGIVEPISRQDVGRIVVPMAVENLEDLIMVEHKSMAGEEVRRIDVSALVDTGAKYVSLPSSFVSE
jgi:hypothetical protein